MLSTVGARIEIVLKQVCPPQPPTLPGAPPQYPPVMNSADGTNAMGTEFCQSHKDLMRTVSKQ